MALTWNWKVHTEMHKMYAYDTLHLTFQANVINFFYFHVSSIWISPMFPKLSSTSSPSAGGLLAGDSVSHFKRDLIEYLAAYKMKSLLNWVEHIKQHDMSHAKWVERALNCKTFFRLDFLKLTLGKQSGAKPYQSSNIIYLNVGLVNFGTSTVYSLVKIH